MNAAAQVVLSLNTIVGRMIDSPNDPVVIGVSTVHAGDASNVIPEDAVVTGTIRTWSDATRARTMKMVEDRAIAMAEANGCEVEVSFRKKGPFYNSRGEEWDSEPYPAVVNNPVLFKMGALTATQLFKGDGAELADIFVENPTTSFAGEGASPRMAPRPCVVPIGAYAGGQLQQLTA